LLLQVVHASQFGADAALYINIERWDAQYMVFTTTMTVALSYEIRDGKTDEVLWKNNAQIVYQPNNSGGGGIGGLIANAITAAVTKAAPNYMPLAHQANAVALYTYPRCWHPFWAVQNQRKTTLMQAVRHLTRKLKRG
jgi:hypothetical protein